jgi:dTDP-4-dehydrorhamnose 3,5-epimerase
MTKVYETTLPGVLIVEPTVYGDERGFFMESYNQATFESLGLPSTFVQDNHSRSTRGVLRGLHYQYPQWQGKLIRAIQGEIFDVAVDIRRSSPTFGRWYGTLLSAENRRQMYVPPGFAHGFCVVSDAAEIIYKCTALYKPTDDAGIRWDDPAIGIEWPIDNPVLSDKDREAPLLDQLPDLS